MTTTAQRPPSPPSPPPTPDSYEPVSFYEEPEELELEPEEIPAQSPPAQTERPRRTNVSKLHRAITVLALIALFVGTHDDWQAMIWPYPGVAILIVCGYGLVLVFAILALTVQRRRPMAFVDVGVLVTTLLIRLPSFFVSFPKLPPGASAYVNDEGPLVDMAGGALSHGLDPFNVIWAAPSLGPTKGVTETMAGGVVDTFDYPPLSAVADYLVRPLSNTVPAAAVLGMAALVIAAVLMFLILPAPWRCAGPMVVLGFDVMPPIARNGYPMIMMLPFLFVAVAGWARIGRPRADGTGGGRLGARGWSGAICLGLAMGFQQLGWFIAPFLVVGLLVVRAGDLPFRRALWLAIRYGGIAFGVLAAANVPFAVVDFRTWWDGVLMPLTDSATPHGQGLIDIPLFLTGGSGYINGFAHAALLLLFGFLIVSVLFMRRIGPAMVVLPWAVFYLSVRSQDNYFLVTAPLWIIALATLSRSDFEHAWQPWRGRVFASWPVRTVAFLALLAPAVLFTVSATTSPEPLQMSIVSLTASRTTGNVKLMTVNVTNVSAQPITPHFALSDDITMSRFFVPLTGPLTVQAGQQATYLLMAWESSSRSILGNQRLLLRAVSDQPVTLSSVAVPGSHNVPPVPPVPVGPSVRHPPFRSRAL